ncbi:hypothetical protein NMY27_07510 [Cronobacter dublinensis subsp. beijingensis]|uniref:hypothetical protein n=1 Tax=Cronobacter dublinensis TaxID=413497 RepID=UPI0023D9B208|nr:hypothetical protein [Cronobacter dublinensis]WEP51028.1 hypothetical protein NMY27_07510 [Cronobacter dublinensis]
MSGTVILPTFSGHFFHASNLINTIRKTSGDIKIDVIISKADEELFSKYKNDDFCEIKYIEDLIKEYSGVDISATDLLKSIGKFRFQALKKLLGVLYCKTSLALVLDSETNIVKNLNEMFSEGIENTSVLYSHRQWDKVPHSLTTEVRTEVNILLEEHSDFWFFESFNWVYDIQILKRMFSVIESKFGKDWIFRQKPLFECQLYYQFAYSQNSSYKFTRVEQLFLEHFGNEYGNKIIDRFWGSSFTFCGMIEYAAYLMSKEEYISFVTDPRVTHHLRLVRHEPPLIYDVVDIARKQSSPKEYYGEAAMHRGDFTRGKIAVLISGDFHHLENILNIKNFLAGVECDLFVSVLEDSYLVPLINELLSPVAIVAVDDNLQLGNHTKVLALSEGLPERATKPNRDIGVANMFDKLAVAYQAMKKHQLNTAEDYSIVVRVRPDIFSTARLKDVFFDVAEHSQIDDETIFFPNRFWSQGINDQFFFGKSNPMESLLDMLTGNNYINCEYQNPEYFLGNTLLAQKLKPVAFNFNYILMRGQRAEIHSINSKLSEQEGAFWSKTIPYPCWKDLSAHLKNILNNVYIKNAQLEVSSIFTFNRQHMDFFYGKTSEGKLYAFTSQQKSPHVKVSLVRKMYIPFLSYLMVFGYPYTITDTSNVTLLSYAEEKKEIKIKTENGVESLKIYTPKPSTFAWLIVQIAKKTRRVLIRIIRR